MNMIGYITLLYHRCCVVLVGVQPAWNSSCCKCNSRGCCKVETRRCRLFMW